MLDDVKQAKNNESNLNASLVKESDENSMEKKRSEPEQNEPVTME